MGVPTISAMMSPMEISPDAEQRLEKFDEATRRQREREAKLPILEESLVRGWAREDLYDRAQNRYVTPIDTTG